MSSHIETKAIQLRDQAVKKMSPTGFFQALFGNGKTDEAIEYYTRAGNLFKMAKNWLQAGLAFTDAADLNYQKEDYLEAAINYSEAAHCFKMIDVAKAVEFYLKAIKLYSEMGKYLTAAKLHQTIGDLMSDERDVNGATRHYERAAELFREENHHSMANKALTKVAELSAIEGRYSKAIKLFQNIACFDLSSSLMKVHARDFFFRAAICHLCHDFEVVENVVNRYSAMLSSFKDSREYHLIICLLDCMLDKDLEGFANAVRTYDAASKLGMWHVTMLLRAKNIILNECDYQLEIC